MSAKTRPIRVLQSMSAPDGTTKFAVQMAEGAPADVEQHFFSWRDALLRGYDVFHVHWPEFLFRAGTRPRSLVKYALTVLLLTRITIRRTPIVRTVHNETPHESGGIAETWLLRWLTTMTRHYVVLNPFSVTPEDRPVTLIPHGHYRDWFRARRAAPVSGRLISCGLLRPYKGIESLMEALLSTSYSDLCLHVVGKPVDVEFASQLRRLAAESPRIRLTTEFVPDDVLVDEILASELVVLPYKKMHNSGIVFVALSLNRPVLVPRNEVNEWIAGEVGSGWVHFFDGGFDDEDLETAIRSLRTDAPLSEPSFTSRSWEEAGRAYASVYRKVLS